MCKRDDNTVTHTQRSSSVTRSDMNPPCDDRFIKHSAAPDLCAEYNGGCHLNADCNQTGLIVNCTCQTGYQGDGYSCQPINRWAWHIFF